MEQLVENLREAFATGIDGLEWMGPETKKQAQEKLAKFRPKIGYPNKWRDYSKLEIKKDDLVGNVMRAFIAENEYQLGKVGKPIDPEQWGMTPQTVNAYYNPVRNEIVFPAAILQPPFFNLDADDAVNYGGIGGVIGHEMGHGFDDQGRKSTPRACCATGGRRRTPRNTEAREGARRAVQRVRAAAGAERQRRAHARREHRRPHRRGDRPPRLPDLAQRTSRADDRRPHGDQRFYMVWAQAWARQDARRCAAPAGDDRIRTRPRCIAPTAGAEHSRSSTTFDVKEGDKMFLAPDQRAKIW